MPYSLFLNKLPYNPEIIVPLKVKNLGNLIPDRKAGECEQGTLLIDYLTVSRIRR